jgi:hypothetical protein
MYQIDTNINTALERQADHVRAVKAYGSRGATEQADRSWASLVLAVAAPIAVLVALGLMVH